MNEKDTSLLNLKIRSMTIGFMIISGIFLPVMIGILYVTSSPPKYTTSVYHFNAEYRAGLTDETQDVLHEDVIIGQAIPAVVAMFEKHPNWKWTLELQGYAIEKMKTLNNTAFEMLRDQVNRGQCELISVFYSYQLIVAHTFNSTIEGIVYNRQLLEDLGFTRFSESIFFQESQTLPGFGMLNQPLFEEHGIRFRNLLISSSTLSLYNIDVNTPMYKVMPFNNPTYSFNYIVYNYLPLYEADSLHSWTWVAPGETISGKNDWTTQGANAYFTPYPPNIEWHEERLQNLEDSGYTSLTCDEWGDICEEKSAYKELNTFLPETTWRASDSQSVWTWMGKNKEFGNDDGSQLAQIYRTTNYIRGVENLFNNKYSQLISINSGITQEIENNITLSWRDLFKSMSTDAVGWKPNYEESNYSRNHCESAQIRLQWTVKNILNTLSMTGPLQILNFNYTILESDFLIPQNKTNTNLKLDNLPVDISIETSKFDYNYSVSEMRYLGINYLQLDLYANCTVISEDEEIFIKISPKTDTTSNDSPIYPIQYSPTLFENELQAFNYNDIGRTLYLPLTNGLFYINDQAIIKNCSSRHVSLRVEENQIGFYEKGNNIELMHYQLLFPFSQLTAGDENGSLTQEDVISFANKINTQGVVMLG